MSGLQRGKQVNLVIRLNFWTERKQLRCPDTRLLNLTRKAIYQTNISLIYPNVLFFILSPELSCCYVIFMRLALLGIDVYMKNINHDPCFSVFFSFFFCFNMFSNEQMICFLLIQSEDAAFRDIRSFSSNHVPSQPDAVIGLIIFFVCASHVLPAEWPREARLRSAWITSLWLDC